MNKRDDDRNHHQLYDLNEFLDFAKQIEETPEKKLINLTVDITKVLNNMIESEKNPYDKIVLNSSLDLLLKFTDNMKYYKITTNKFNSS